MTGLGSRRAEQTQGSEHLSRLGVDSVTQGRRREHDTSPYPTKSLISGFGGQPATTSNAACYWALDGGVRVEYDPKEKF